MDILYHNCKSNGKKTKKIPLISIIICIIIDGSIVSLVVYFEVLEGTREEVKQKFNNLVEIYLPIQKWLLCMNPSIPYYLIIVEQQ
jgi:hypothetical protein